MSVIINDMRQNGANLSNIFISFIYFLNVIRIPLGAYQGLDALHSAIIFA